MSNKIAASAEDAAIARWDLPAVEGPLVQRRGAGVNVMHLEAVERDAWEQGLAAGHAEGVRRGEAELAARIGDVNVKYAALEAILGTLAKPLDQLDTAMEHELTRLALIIAKHLVRRELRLDPSQVIGIIRHTVGLLPLATRDMKVHLHPADAAIVRERLATPAGESEWVLKEDPLLARGGCRITTATSSIDARLETRVAEAVNSLLGEVGPARERSAAADEADDAEARGESGADDTGSPA
ncbi:MAG TPA: flagellar assembly protein FliH [Steroidobacteraceae bacterium]|nr:flagellar assembly protein FliH [Steroidobacteraceae bacterium]